MTKFWSMTTSVTPSITAKVMVVVAMMMQVRFFMNSGVRRRFGTTKRMTAKLMSVATMA